MNRWIMLLIVVLVAATACGAPDMAVPELPPISANATAASTMSKAPPAAIEPLALVGWQEPQTGAFLTNVPDGWLAQGNVSSSYGLLHPWLEMAEPTGGAAILIGYRQLTLHLLPHPLLDQAGYPAGTAVPLDDGAQLPVTPFQTGEAAAEAEAIARLQGVCTDLVIVDRRSTDTTLDGEVETSEGEVTFQCVAEGMQLVGEYRAATRKLVNPQDGSGIWFSDNVAGYLAQTAYSQPASSAFEAVLASFMFSPQWQAAQQSVPGLRGLFFDRSSQSSGASGHFFEDQVFEWCISNGLSC